MENKKSKPYKELCLKDKIEVINFLKTNSQRTAADRFQISKTCVSNIFKRKLEYQNRYEENENEARSRKTENLEINQATFEWFKKMRGMNARVSGPLLREAAMEFSKKLNVENFTASNGWLESFKKRNNISQKILSGESHDVDMETVESFKDRISNLVADYKEEDIFNADECGLFYRAMPTKTLAMAGDKCKDGKISKERITILLSCSLTGEKLKPLVIGKDRKSRCFKKVNFKNLPVLWYGNKRVWIYTIDLQSEDNDNTLSNIQQLITQLPLDNKLENAEFFMNFDSDIHTCSTSVDQESMIQEICDMFTNGEGTEKENEDCCSEDEVEEVDEIYDAEMLTMCKKMKSYALNKCPAMLGLLSKLECMTENIVENKCFKQRKISDFFNVNES